MSESPRLEVGAGVEVRGAGSGALHGRFINHPAALAATSREPIDLDALPKLGKVAEYPRMGAPITVVRERAGFGVYLGERRIGGQYSFPDLGDCERMLSAPPKVAPIEERLSVEARFALALQLDPVNPAKRKKAMSEARRRAVEAFKESSRRMFASGNGSRRRAA